jgi:phage FluMu gp28-like protein
MSPHTFFLPYQQRWLADRSRLKICEKGRQIGMTYADAFDSVMKAASVRGRDVWVMSRDEAQAKQYIRYCKRWADLLNHISLACAGERVLRLRKGRAFLAQALCFVNGRSIYALSSNPDAVVGKTGHVKLDEFAIHKDQRTLYAIAKPVIQWGGTLSVISTHRGIGTVFNEIITDIRQGGNRMGWSLHSCPIQRAVEEGIVERIEGRGKFQIPTSNIPERSEFQAPAGKGARGEERAAVEGRRAAWLARQRAECIDEEQWLQEYCCVPADEAAAFISYELLNACTEPGLELKSGAELAAWVEGVSGAALYVGVDVARKRDLCVLDVGEKIGDVVWDRARIELLNRPFGEIEEELYRFLRLRQVKRVCIDASGLGLQLAERASERFNWKVEGITFTARTKEDLANGLKIDLEQQRLRLVDDDKLRADLRAIRKEVTVGGHCRYAGESADSHCDRFWAKALRQQAARHRVYAAAAVG